MSLDGIVIKSLVNELNLKILNGRIEKIYQPERDEIILNIRNKGEKFKLLLSASSNNPRVHITESVKGNPLNPPMFCMLLRKHLQGGRIVNISQPSLERIVKIDIQSLDELGILSTKELIIEVMGRHSNIILIDKTSSKVIDSIKRITPDISSVRLILPGLEYKLPPTQNKINPLSINNDLLVGVIESHNKGDLLYKSIYKTFVGISPLIARELCWKAGIEPHIPIGALSNHHKEALTAVFDDLMESIKANIYTPTIIINEEDNKVTAFSAIDIKQFGDLSKHHFDSMSNVLEEYYVIRDRYERIKQKSIDFKKTISIKLERNQNKLAKQKNELLNAKKREKYKICGDLITSNMYKIEKGQKEIICLNYYSPTQEEITVALDPRLTPSQNAQKYYKRYNKLKTALSVVSDQIKKTLEDIEYLENILLSIQNCSEINELEEIREELIAEGYLKDKNKRKKDKRKQQSSVSKPKHFISSDHYDIYVGKNNKQNDYLTIKFASKNDIWLHTKEIPGSHVIIKSKGEDIPENTLIEAALLAAFHSKGSMSSNVPVDYTERKNVKKPNGSKPGMVIYDNNNTIYVTPKKEEVNKLIKVEN